MKKPIIVLLCLVLLLTASVANADTRTLWDLRFDMTPDEVEAYLTNVKHLEIEKLSNGNLQTKEDYHFTVSGYSCDSLLYEVGKQTTTLTFNLNNLYTYREWHRDILTMLLERYVESKCTIVEVWNVTENSYSRENDYYFKMTQNNRELMAFDIFNYACSWEYFDMTSTYMVADMMFDNVWVKEAYDFSTGRLYCKISYHSRNVAQEFLNASYFPYGELNKGNSSKYQDTGF